MNFRKVLLVLALLLSGIPLRGAVFDVWTFNNQNLQPDLGSAKLEASWLGAGLGTLTYASGTELGAPPETEAGWSLSFLDVLTGFSDHEIFISGLDLSGMSSFTLQFALRSNEIFELHESADVSYRLDGGEWLEIQDMALPESDWSLREFTFTLPVADLSKVQLRIRHNAVFDAGKVLSVDNITVTSSIPEPSTKGLMAAGALAAVLFAGRKLRSASGSGPKG